MIGTQENGGRVLFCEGVMLGKDGSRSSQDYRPDFFWYPDVNGVYVELRSMGEDYILETMIITKGNAEKHYMIMNEGFETESARIRHAIAVFDNEVICHEALQKAIKASSIESQEPF